MRLTVLLLALLSALPCSYAVTVCFTPGQACSALLVKRIAMVRSQIKVQAYSFTSPTLGQALLKARQRGVEVKMLFDKTQFDCQHYSYAGHFFGHGIKMRVDVKPAIAHNKIMIGDQSWVETGSFNFTVAAQQHNAENMLFLSSPAVVKRYLDNWRDRWQQSVAIVRDPCRFRTAAAQS